MPYKIENMVDAGAARKGSSLLEASATASAAFEASGRRTSSCGKRQAFEGFVKTFPCFFKKIRAFSMGPRFFESAFYDTHFSMGFRAFQLSVLIIFPVSIVAVCTRCRFCCSFLCPLSVITFSFFFIDFPCFP
jgi:hypothetical protein